MIVLRALLEVRVVVRLLLVVTLTISVCKEFGCYEEMNIFLLFIDCFVCVFIHRLTRCDLAGTLVG